MHVALKKIEWGASNLIHGMTLANLSKAKHHTFCKGSGKKVMNWVVGKSSRKKELGDMLTGMIADKEAQKALWSPWFLFKTILLP